MPRQVTLGGDRLGSGKRMKVELHGYERSTHDLSYLWRSTMSSGTLVPFMTEVALPGDTFDINLNCDIKTHPTIGPLFGSYKVQLDIFQCPVRLYQAQLHNNKQKIGMNMAAIKLPQITLYATDISNAVDKDNAQINPSCILSYLGIRGVGGIPNTLDINREFNGLPLLMYWDIYKNYYANQQEEIGAVIHTEVPTIHETVDTIVVGGGALPQAPTPANINIGLNTLITVNYTGTRPTPDTIRIMLQETGEYNLDQIAKLTSQSAGVDNYVVENTFGSAKAVWWNYIDNITPIIQEPKVATFALSKLDDMREAILADVLSPDPFNINDQDITPYNYVASPTSIAADALRSVQYSQEGLALKTYQSDLFNNWLNKEWIDGVNGIAEITAISTAGDKFTIDALRLGSKVNNMLNRIMVSGGTYQDWESAVYDHERYVMAETPMYCGGLIKELIFQEVISNSESIVNGATGQPLGTLAGRGTMANKHKGGQIHIKVDEISYIIGIISLTPRIDNSQGNKWDTHLETMDDFHKPALDEIGFQDLIAEQMAWWTTNRDAGSGNWLTQSVGKQPAWINYMTNVNVTRGNFAIATNEMFMTLNRRYEYDAGTIGDLTTYIDPVKFNNIFAQTALDAQNFWAQIAVDITARRKMSAKVMPNL